MNQAPESNGIDAVACWRRWAQPRCCCRAVPCSVKPSPRAAATSAWWSSAPAAGSPSSTPAGARLLAEVALGDLSHASVVFSRDGRFAYVFGRDGGLSKVDLLRRRLVARVMQAGNSIGGAVSADGSLVAAQNYQPGGVKVFDARTLELVADLPAEYAPGRLARGRPGRPAGPAVLPTACSTPTRSGSPTCPMSASP